MKGHGEGPKRTLGEAVARSAVGRTVRGTAKFIHHIDLKGTDKLASGEEVMRHIGNALHLMPLAKGIKGLQAQWEAYRFAELQKPHKAKRVGELREYLHSLESDVAGQQGSREEERTEWITQIQGEISGLNSELETLLPGSGYVIGDDWTTYDELESELRTFIKEFVPYYRELTAQDQDDDEETIETKRVLFDNLVRIKQEIGTVLEGVKDQKRKDAEVERATVGSERRAIKIRTKGALPEVHIHNREKLLAERERLEYDLHETQLVRRRIKRKVQETWEDMRELFSGREPDHAREAREKLSNTYIQDVLEQLAERAEHFASLTDTAEYIEGKKDVADIERRPLVHEFEKVLETEHMPARTRALAYDIINRFVMSRTDGFFLRARDELAAEGRVARRYRPLTFACIEQLKVLFDGGYELTEEVPEDEVSEDENI